MGKVMILQLSGWMQQLYWSCSAKARMKIPEASEGFCSPSLSLFSSPSMPGSSPQVSKLGCRP